MLAGAGVSWECLSLGAWCPAPCSRSVHRSTWLGPLGTYALSIWFCFTREDQSLSWRRHESVDSVPLPKATLGLLITVLRQSAAGGAQVSGSGQEGGPPPGQPLCSALGEPREGELPLGHSLVLSLVVQGPLPLSPNGPGDSVWGGAHTSYVSVQGTVVPACHRP